MTSTVGISPSSSSSVFRRLGICFLVKHSSVTFVMIVKLREASNDEPGTAPALAVTVLMGIAAGSFRDQNGWFVHVLGLVTFFAVGKVSL